MNVSRPVKNFGRAAPDHHGARDTGAMLELADVLHQHLGLVHFRARFFQIGAADVAARIPDRRPPPSDAALERLAQLLEQRRLPARPHVSQLRTRCPRRCPIRRRPRSSRFGERNEILDQRTAAFGALAEAHRRQLRQRSDRRAEPALHRLDARDESGGNRAHARHQDAEFPIRGSDSVEPFFSEADTKRIPFFASANGAAPS